MISSFATQPGPQVIDQAERALTHLREAELRSVARQRSLVDETSTSSRRLAG